MRFIFTIIVFVLISSNARAGRDFFLEPYVGFSKMEVGIKTAYYKDVSDNYIIGVRSGFQFGNVLTGLDYHSGGPYKFSAAINQGEWTTRSLGAILGADYKVIRFWTAYYPSAKINDTRNNETWTGSAFKVGFGLVISKEVRANIEVMGYDLDSRELYGTTESYEMYYPKETNAYISIPVEL